MFDVKSGLAAEAKKQSRKYNISSHPNRPRRKRSPEMMACTVPETPGEMLSICRSLTLFLNVKEKKMFDNVYIWIYHK